MYSYETRRPSAAIRGKFVSQWRKSQLGVGTKAERERQRKNKYLYKTRTAMQQNPADVNAASSNTEISLPCSANVFQCSIGEMRMKCTQNYSRTLKANRPIARPGRRDENKNWS